MLCQQEVHRLEVAVYHIATVQEVESTPDGSTPVQHLRAKAVFNTPCDSYVHVCLLETGTPECHVVLLALGHVVML